MSYFEEIDAWLRATLFPLNEDEEVEEEVWFARVSKEIKAKILESYRNGQKAGPAPEPRDERPREGGRRPNFRSRWKKGGRQ
jgi:hypothetical protein